MLSDRNTESIFLPIPHRCGSQLGLFVANLTTTFHFKGKVHRTIRSLISDLHL